MKIFIGLGGLVFALLLTLPALAASDQDMQVLLKEMRELKAKVAELEPLKKRVAELEKKLAGRQVQKAAQPSPGMLHESGEHAPPGRAKPDRSVPVRKQEPGKQLVQSDKPSLDFNGFLRMNYRMSSFNDKQRSRGGDGLFNVLALGLEGSWRKVLVDVQYRWYSNQNMIHHAWAGYDFTENQQGQLGITLTPLGLLPSASHNWFGAATYYTGLSLAYDMGFKYLYHPGPWDLQLAFFKNPAYGNPQRLERYSFDVVEQGDQTNAETNQLNARLAYTFRPAPKTTIEVGFSGQWGQLYNKTSDSFGSHWALGPHLDAKFGQWGLQFEALRYQYNPQNPAGVSNDSILRGGFGRSFFVASEATLLVGNLSYDVPVEWGPVTSLLFYNDFSTSLKQKSGWENSYLNTLGCYISADPIFTWVDLVMGKNMYSLDGSRDGLAAGDPDAGWDMMLNINLGIYW